MILFHCVLLFIRGNIYLERRLLVYKEGVCATVKHVWRIFLDRFLIYHVSAFYLFPRHKGVNDSSHLYVCT